MKQSKDMKETAMAKPINLREVKRSSVTIRKVDNGFIVEGCKGDYMNEKTYVYSTEEEAKKQAAKML